MATYRAYQVTGTREFEFVTRETAPPPAGHVRIDVESCGVCHSDAVTVEGLRDDPGRRSCRATRSSASSPRSATA